MIFHTTSKKPVFLVGNGARAAGALEEVYQIIEKAHIPVLTSLNTVDMVQGQFRIGFIGTYGNRAANTIIAECDLIVAVGIRLGLRQIGNQPELFAPNAKLIRADIDQAELSRQVKEDEEKYLIDAKEFLIRLLDEKLPDYGEWFGRCLALRDYLEGTDDELGNLVVKKIGSILPQNPIVAVDIGQTMCWTAQSLWLKGKYGRIIIGGSYGAMGVGLPYAIGASIFGKRSIVYCITGDGGLQMNIQELEVVARERLPIKILVFNNHALGKITEVQEKAYSGRFAQTTKSSGYSVPDFEKIALAYGIKAAALDSYEALVDYSDWMVDDEACLLNIMLPENTKLIPKIEFNTMEVMPKLPQEVEKKAREIIRGLNSKEDGDAHIWN